MLKKYFVVYKAVTDNGGTMEGSATIESDTRDVDDLIKFAEDIASRLVENKCGVLCDHVTITNIIPVEQLMGIDRTQINDPGTIVDDIICILRDARAELLNDIVEYEQYLEDPVRKTCICIAKAKISILKDVITKISDEYQHC